MAQQKHYRLRAAARSSTKAQEKALVEKAGRLLEDPDPAFPACEGSCWFCEFKGGRRKLERVRDIADDEKRLEAATERGNEYAKAYAAMLLLRKKGKVPYLFTAKTPFGDIAYAVRGKARKDLLIGFQFYDHPKIRLVAVMDAVRRKKLHVFSFDDRMVCRGRVAAPPKGFVDHLVRQLKVELLEDRGDFVCRHLKSARPTKSGMAPLPYLEVDWLPARTRFRICEKCAREKDNTLLTLLTSMAIPDPRKEFRFNMKGGFECCSDCPACKIPTTELDKELREKYLHGELDDRGVIQNQAMKLVRELRESGTKVYILGRKCFGRDLEAFIEAMKPTEEERTGLKAVLKAVKGPVIVEGETAGKMLETFWEQCGLDAMEAVCGDAEVARALLRKHEGSKMSPSQLLKEAMAGVREKEIIANLPVYRKLPAVARFADEMARVFFTRGKEDLARAIERYQTEDSSVKSTAFALLLATGLEASKNWQYQTHEREFAEYLLPAAKKFLGSTPEDYHRNLQELLSATGSTEVIKEPENRSRQSSAT